MRASVRPNSHPQTLNPHADELEGDGLLRASVRRKPYPQTLNPDADELEGDGLLRGSLRPDAHRRRGAGGAYVSQFNVQGTGGVLLSSARACM